MRIKYEYCPQCKNQLILRRGNPYCPKCHITIYSNPAPCASVIPIKDGQALLAIRAVEPYKGELDLIGGFMKNGENPEEAVLRETEEETNLTIQIVDLLGIYPDQYGKGGDYTLCFTYVAKIISGKPKAHDDISELKWIDINKIPSIHGFKNTTVSLKDLKKWWLKNSSTV